MKIGKTKNKLKYNLSRAEIGLIVALIAPAIIHWIIFWFPVQIQTILMAFKDVATQEWTFKNFTWLYNVFIVGDLGQAFINTFIFFAVGMLLVPVSVFFCYAIYRKCLLHGFIRVALYLPGAISSIMMTLLYGKLMESSGPIMNLYQELTGTEELIFLKVNNGMLYVLIFDILMGVSGNLIIWLGTMSRIPYDLIEYGQLEGITPLREFRTVVLPLIWPTFVTMMCLKVIGIFGSSGSVMLLTNGQYGTMTLSYWMYQQVLSGITSEYNHASALGLCLTVATLPLVVVFRKIANRFGGEVEY